MNIKAKPNSHGCSLRSGANEEMKDGMREEIRLSIKPEMLIEAVKAMKKKDRDAFLEDLLAATSPDFLKSIQEARADYRAGRVFSHHDLFGK
jgi:hypothetical protein